MTGDEQRGNSEEQQITAAALRQSIAEKEGAKLDESLKKRAEADREMEKLFQEFLEEQITQKELDDIRQSILRATERGELEVQVMRFPSKLCTDSGRAINNRAPGWPETLQGKAKSFYDFFVERGRPHGFKLKAEILDFPGGVPGNVGLIVSWSEG